MTAGKWQVQSDDYGNIYFYNSLTGEAVWELPDEESEVADETVDSPRKVVEVEKPRGQDSVYTVAVGVADVMVKIVETIEKNAEQVKKSKVKRKFMSPAAEKRSLKNAANEDKKKKHLHDRTLTTYINVLIPKIEPGNSQEIEKPREVGSLFTAEESRRWLQERDQEREAKRRALRRARRQHHAKVESLQRHQHMLIMFRSDLMKYLLGKIKCSTELQKQRILLLTTPQMLAEMKEWKREMQMKLEPEIAEKTMAEERLTQQKYDKNVRKVFATIDEAGAGRLHLLQIIFGVFSKEKPQKYAAQVRGLAELLDSPELQRFLIDFVSQSTRNEVTASRLITVSEFREFVSIIEEVLDHYVGVKAAVEDAENDIETTLAAASSGGVSLAQARMGALSEKKIKHELAVLKEHEAQLEAVRQREKKKGFGAEGASLMASKEEWEKNHHHRLIRLEENSPVYCCLCRKRKWELWRREQEERESEYRSHWSTMLALRVKDEELRFVKECDRENGIPIEANGPVRPTVPDKQEHDSSIMETKYELVGFEGRTDESFLVVRETLVFLVRLVESIADEESSESEKTSRRAHKKPVKRSPRKRVKEPPTTEVQERIKVFEHEEQERKTMYSEELHMVIMLERNRRSLERPLLRVEDAAHDAFLRLLERCVNPSGFLLRLNFEHCLSFSPPQRMVLAVYDNSIKAKRLSNRLVLHTIPCRSEQMAEYVFSQVTSMQKTLQSPFVTEVVSVDKHMFQLFSELGLLIECWPVVIVVTEYFECGSWLMHYRKYFIDENAKYSAVEQHLRNVFREVASGLAAMHSLGLLHLNINLGNIYVSETQENVIHVKIGGILSWKNDFEVVNLQSSNMHYSFDYNYMPPEAVKEAQITAKADAWMLGCGLCEALFMWQQQQLILSTPNQQAQVMQPIIFHTKSISELLQKLPIATSATMRSLIGMLLQPNPTQRPQMSQIVDLLCRNNTM